MVKEVIRVVCPVCGMMTDADQMVKTHEKKPPKILIFRQRFGGKVAGEPSPLLLGKKGKGKTKGFMEYTDITSQVPTIVAEVQKFFDERIKLYQEGKK